MGREASAFEYRDIIIPIHQEEIERNLIRANKYLEGSDERKALLLSVENLILEIERLKLRVKELSGYSDDLEKYKKEISLKQEKISSEIEELGLDLACL